MKDLLRWLVAALATISLAVPAAATGLLSIDNQAGVGGPELMFGSADQLYAMDHTGTNAEMKDLVGTGLSKVTAGVGSLTISSKSFSNLLSKSSNFTAVPGEAYAVTATADVTLPSAVGHTGETILVINAGASSVLTIRTTSAQTVNLKSSGSITNAVQYDHLLFTSDGANWFGSKQSGL